MNEVTVFVYLCFVALFGMTFAFVFKMMTATLEMDRSPVNSYGDAMKPYKTTHPEMDEVKNDELLVLKWRMRRKMIIPYFQNS